MAKRGGFPGGMGMPGNMNNLMKQAQKMQRHLSMRLMPKLGLFTWCKILLLACLTTSLVPIKISQM